MSWMKSSWNISNWSPFNVNTESISMSELDSVNSAVAHPGFSWRGASTPKMGVLTYYFAWKWKNLDPRGVIGPPSSATDFYGYEVNTSSSWLRVQNCVRRSSDMMADVKKEKIAAARKKVDLPEITVFLFSVDWLKQSSHYYFL